MKKLNHLPNRVLSKMFGTSKVDVLESKLDIYEDLSKEMLAKLESAVEKISENSQRVAVVLERHENRLNENEKTYDVIMKLVEKIEDNLTELEKKVDAISKFRWVAVGVTTAAVVVIQFSELFGRVLNDNNNNTRDLTAHVIHDTVVERNFPGDVSN